MKFILLFFVTLSVQAETMGPRASWSMIGQILKVSENKDVILFNKGHEDGMAKGDHAWFWSHKDKGFRAECIDISESRSIWQIYRVEVEDLIQPQLALRARQATKPIYVPSPDTDDQL